MTKFKKEQIVKIRELKDMTQSQFGKFLGISRQLVFLWEKGESEPGCKMLSRIVDRCGIPIQSLFGEA